LIQSLYIVLIRPEKPEDYLSTWIYKGIGKGVVSIYNLYMEIIDRLLGRKQTTRQIFNGFIRTVKHPNPEWSDLGPARLGIHSHLILAEGVDSIVCRADENPDYVLKVYNFQVSQENIKQLDFYQDLINKAGMLLPSFHLEPQTEINPILSFEYWAEKDRMVGISKSIPGYNLKSIFSDNLFRDPDMLAIRKVMTDTGLSEKIVMKKNSDLSEKLNNVLDVNGISIVPLNVMVNPVTPISNDRLKFVITDLAGSILHIYKK
jgi:hypothetical protein